MYEEWFKYKLNREELLQKTRMVMRKLLPEISYEI